MVLWRGYTRPDIIRASSNPVLDTKGPDVVATQARSAKNMWAQREQKSPGDNKVAEIRKKPEEEDKRLADLQRVNNERRNSQENLAPQVLERPSPAVMKRPAPNITMQKPAKSDEDLRQQKAESDKLTNILYRSTRNVSLFVVTS